MRTAHHVFWNALVISLTVFAGSSVLAAIVERGPYLQQVTPGSITVRWRTDNATDAVVRYGLATDALNLSAVGNQSGTEHEVTVSGLSPGTLYYYSVGDSAETFAGGDSSFRFLTSPTSSFSGGTRVWVVGDSGTADNNASAVRDAYIAYSGNKPADIWLMLGDNAYNDGTDAEYQGAVFDMYPTILRSTPLWPTIGNHDGHSADSNSQQGPYYDIFTMPKNAEAGGIASGTEAYYSFDYGSIHFVTLDSYETDRSAGGAMLTWLENDLASTSQEWLIAFWHHPPYTKGSHDSDSEGKLIDMRERAVPILESYGVDLVLTGHSHSYERSFLIDGHYGSSSTFDVSSMLIDGGSGRADDQGPYSKPVVGNPNQGTVYAVAGSSGKTSSGSLNHPVMFVSLQILGSMVLDVDGDRLDASFIDSSGTRRDYFTIQKGEPVVDDEAPTPVSNLQVSNLGQTSLRLSWQAASDNVSVTGYRIARDDVVLTTTASLTYDDSGLAAGTQYAYAVVALDAAGNESVPATASAITASAPDVGAPTAPGNLTVSNLGQTSLRLSWQAASDNVSVTGYRIARDGVVLTTTASLTYDDSGLAAGTQYAYAVVALDAAGNESVPATASAITASAPDVGAPTAPGNLTVSNLGQTSLRLSWQAASDNVSVTGYRIARDGVVLTTTASLTYDDSGLAAGTQYAYAVVALDAAGNESVPATVSATTASVTTQTIPTGGGGGSVGVFALFVLATSLVVFQRPALRRAILAMCLVLLFGTPPPAVAHADIDEQLAAVNARLADAQDDHHLLVQRGNLHGQHGDWQFAVADLKRAQVLAPDEEAAAIDLDIGLALLHSGNAEQALPFVDRYLVKHATSSVAWRVRAQIQLGLRETDAALEAFNRCIHYAPVRTPEHYIERARILEHEPDRSDELLAGIDDGIDALGPLASLLEYAIGIELQRGSYAGALIRIDSLPKPVGRLPRWLYKRSQVLLKLERNAEAQTMNRLALQAIEELPPPRRNNTAYDTLKREIESSYEEMINRKAS